MDIVRLKKNVITIMYFEIRIRVSVNLLRDIRYNYFLLTGFKSKSRLSIRLFFVLPQNFILGDPILMFQQGF